MVIQWKDKCKLFWFFMTPALVFTLHLAPYLPQEHSKQEEDENSHQQTDGNDPSDNISARLQIVQSLKDHLQSNWKKRSFLWLGVALFSLVPIKQTAWWPRWSYFICQTTMGSALNFMLSLYLVCKGFKAFKWNLSSHTLDPKDTSICFQGTLTLRVPHPRH